ncbi:MAG: hypothetical protein R3F61_38045 [Myxococcota bacterium]
MELVRFPLGGRSASYNYAFLERVKRACDARSVRFLGFALESDARLLLEGTREAVHDVVRAVKTGSARCAGSRGYLGPTRSTAVGDPLAVLVRLHRAGRRQGPLANVWTSHRDLMGFRQASFFDRSVWAGRIDPRLVHVLAGGGPLPVGFPPPLDRRQALTHDLDLCLRVSAAVLGVLPADRRATRLFCHLGRHVGLAQADLADAVLLTPRRIRQLQREDEPLLAVAARSLGDRRLRQVP